ncbi:related to polyamine oxidase precursor [Armillaria ostoyae]|uniref:Amine oxidase n=1 Tax=Armillaria ostoyae TaxID=47428 RepID=A0A284RI61_ARMOS|nr:related to polyamine oxidase precursor [Armillaria ostoyae]
MTLVVVLTASLALAASVSGSAFPRNNGSSNPRVLILGGGVAGVIAARTLHERGIDNFVIIEARDELGGRMKSQPFAGYTIELGANWCVLRNSFYVQQADTIVDRRVQGTQTGTGPANPIFELALKHNVTTQYNDFYGSITTYDTTGEVDYLDVFNDAVDAYSALTVTGGARVTGSLVDLTSKTGYALNGVKPRDPYEMAAEYYQASISITITYSLRMTLGRSLIGNMLKNLIRPRGLLRLGHANNFTFDADEGGFSEDNLLAIDQRGFKALIQLEAQEFLQPEHVSLNSTVKTISYSRDGAQVTLTSGETIEGDYALCTFSIGVLQDDYVTFEPPLPDYKMEAIQSMTMATYTKIFLKFPEKFWFDTELALYADPTRGTYPVWQSLDHPNFFPGSGLIFATVTGDWSLRVEALSDKQVQDEAMDVLRKMYPNVTIPEPTEFLFPRWNSDPLYRGSYSNWPPSFFSQHHNNLRSNIDRLYFAGEATSQKYFGFLQGAYDEGLKVATNMVECMRGDGCVTLQHVESVKNAFPYEI